ncbi:DNA-directed RNA polymerase II subunit RPB7 [Nematocida major]|uniref:DNA-directed RNA polymerase II subunit RPB7 n=1 Tax=Nematocida major TaxID=1912982 RepID=UPI0020088462|nr:DNA-directed RNA polymerase II subunit RPB7 [Nematocida major]KAH9386258.1 DNA-directed RNA polymerase II subunit RPB7 [Nematocida major]
MFYVRQMQERITLEPKYLGKKLDEIVRKKLISEVEGKCLAGCGYIISIISIDSLYTTEVDATTGAGTFLAEYSALTLCPKKDEVANAVVHEINKMGMFCFIGPFYVFISTHQISGQFIEAGAHSSIIQHDGGSAIVKDSVVRLKLIGVKVEPTKIFGVGTINDDYLGNIQ